jgi:hypothetical protein
MPEECRLCEIRKPRRWCPGIRADICSQCCGQEREVTVDCPFNCPYLREARLHEKLLPANPDEFPNPDIKVSDAFLRDHEPLLIALGRGILQASLQTPGAADSDAREALASLVQTYRTLQSGLVYESLPSNPLAASIHKLLQQSLNDFRERLRRTSGAASLFRDAEVLGILVFLERLAIDWNNGRRRGRAFLDFLNLHFPAAAPPPEPQSPLIL